MVTIIQLLFRIGLYSTFFVEYGFVRIKIVPCMAGRMNIQLFQ